MTKKPFLKGPCTHLHLEVLGLLLILHSSSVTAYVKDSELLPYSESSGSTHFHFSDDKHTQVPFLTTFNFLGNVYSAAHVSGNGIITFGEGSGSTNYYCNTQASTIPAVLAFMADALDENEYASNRTSKLLYRQDTTTRSLDKVSKDVFKAFPNLKGIQLKWMFIVTWHKVKRFGSGGRHRNTFQAILTTDGTHSFVLFYYNQITWPKEALQNTPAQAGIFGGKLNYRNSYLIPGSCNHSLINIPGMSNIDEPGKFVFRVDTTVQLPVVSQCIRSSETRNIDLSFKPNIVSTIHNVPLIVEGFKVCLDANVTMVTCRFHDNSRLKPLTMQGSMLPGQLAVICPTPDFYSLGMKKIGVDVKFSDGGLVSASGFIFVVRGDTSDDDEASLFVEHINGAAANGIPLNPSWSNATTAFLHPKLTQVENFFTKNVNRKYLDNETQNFNNLQIIEMEFVRSGSDHWWDIFTLKSILQKETWRRETPPEMVQTTLLTEKLETLPRALKASHSIIMENGNQLSTSYATDIFPILAELIKNTLKQVEGEPSNNTIANLYDNRCIEWYYREPVPPTDTLPCPPTLQHAISDWRFSNDTSSASISQIMNPNKLTIFLQSVPSLSGAGSYCSYETNNGELVINYPSGSRMHRRSPNSWIYFSNHFSDDIMPYLQCCQLSLQKEENCERYFFRKRPSASNIGSEYTPLVPFRVGGATHVTTFDEATYLLNNAGTFTLLKYDNQMEVQILTESISPSNGTLVATVITSAVIKSGKEGEDKAASKFQVSANLTNGLLIWLNEQPLNFYQDNMFKVNDDYLKESFTLYHDGVNVDISGTSEALFSYSNGFSIKMTLSPENKSINIIGSASETFRGKLTGLLGNFDQNPKNDLKTKSGNLLPENSEVEQISKEFVEQWRIPKNECVFHFPSGESYEKYNKNNNTNFNAVKMSRADVVKMAPDNVKAFCGNVEDCVIDYQLTGNEEFANSSKSTYEQYKWLLDGSKLELHGIPEPKSCGDPGTIPNGKYLGRNKFTVGESIIATCENGYYLKASNNLKNNMSLEDSSFVCLADNEKSRNGSGAATWISFQFWRQPLSYFKFQCVAMDDNKVNQTEQVGKYHQSSNDVGSNNNGSNAVVIFLSFTVFILLLAIVALVIYFTKFQKSFMYKAAGYCDPSPVAINLLDMDELSNN